MTTEVESELRSAPKFDRAGVFASSSSNLLSGLRCMGRSRRQRFIYRWPYCDNGCKGHGSKHMNCGCASKTMAALQLGHHQRKEGVYVDIGCGDSADATIAREAGHYAFAVDLQPPTEVSHYGYKSGIFCKSDIVEGLPFGSNFVDYASCHAVIDLIEPEAREAFYRNLFHCLKPGGLFAFTIVPLKDGYGFSRNEEIERLASVGFWIYRKTYPAIVFKPSSK